MKHLHLFIFSLLVFSYCTTEQDTTTETETIEKSNDELAIEGVIQNYFDGWLTGDTTLVGSAMHTTCHLKFVRDGKVEQRNRTEYLSGFQPRPRLENAEGRILSIDITRTAAEAKVELETENRLFTDYFNLLKEGDRWFITDKVSTNISKE
ncbi:MAG: nuclear transport factor 2 family protein [Saprospiraceae bacterium]|nr:nuclear transport factor 2 family protein [Saprospiraceae bacterium]